MQSRASLLSVSELRSIYRVGKHCMFESGGVRLLCYWMGENISILKEVNRKDDTTKNSVRENLAEIGK